MVPTLVTSVHTLVTRCVITSLISYDRRLDFHHRHVATLMYYLISLSKLSCLLLQVADPSCCGEPYKYSKDLMKTVVIWVFMKDT